MAPVPATQARVCLRNSSTSEGRPAYALIASIFGEAGIEEVSVHRGIMGFDRATETLSARGLRFRADLPVVVEAVGWEGQSGPGCFVRGEDGADPRSHHPREGGAARARLNLAAPPNPRVLARHGHPAPYGEWPQKMAASSRPVPRRRDR